MKNKLFFWSYKYLILLPYYLLNNINRFFDINISSQLHHMREKVQKNLFLQQS